GVVGQGDGDGTRRAVRGDEGPGAGGRQQDVVVHEEHGPRRAGGHGGPQGGPTGPGGEVGAPAGGVAGGPDGRGDGGDHGDVATGGDQTAGPADGGVGDGRRAERHDDDSGRPVGAGVRGCGHADLR